jgi:DNA transformation protein
MRGVPICDSPSQADTANSVCHGCAVDEDAIRDMFAALGPVAVRRMFGGKGIYHNGVIVAVEVGGELMLKADSVSAPDFEEAGCRQWTYTGSRHGKVVSMPYWTAPEAALDDPDEMAVWARKAYEAGLRSGK